MSAEAGTAYHVERLVRLYRQVKRTEALSVENLRHQHRELGWYIDDDGFWVLRGRFTAEQGALIQKSLEHAMEENFQERKDVPAGTSIHCSNNMNKTASTSRQKLVIATGWARKWTIKWRLWVCCSLSEVY